MKSEAVAGNSNVHFKTALSARIPVKAEYHWCHLSDGLSSWHGCQTVRKPSTLTFGQADVRGCSGCICNVCM